MTTLGNGLYAITDCESLDEALLFARSKSILAAGVAALQYRCKQGAPAVRRAQAEHLRGLCRARDTPLIINDDVPLAASIGAAGVHLGCDDETVAAARVLLGRTAIIGASCYDSLERAEEAEELGVDYVAFGAFFATSSKTPRTRAAVDLLSMARARLRIPIVAIGGITPENAGTLIGAGANLVAAIGSLYRHPHPGLQVEKFNRLFGTTP